MEKLRVYISDAVYNAMYPQLSSRLIVSQSLSYVKKKKEGNMGIKGNLKFIQTLML